MARITKVKVWGFRSHISSLFPLAADGLTVITGKNDAGKSAFIQGIKWVAFGEPSGEEFLFTIRDEETEEIIEQAEEAGVEITLDNGVTVTKTRKKGKTQYRVSTIPDPFEKAEVPEEVTQTLGITRSNFGEFETELNFAYQLAAPFILSEPASVGARVLGYIAGTQAVDLAIKSVAKDTYKAREERQQAEKEAGQRSIELLEYQDLETIKEQLDACEILVEQLNQSIRRRDSLKRIFTAYGEVASRIDTLTAELDKLAVLPEIEKDLQNAEKAQQRYDKLLDLYRRYGKATATVEQLTNTLSSFRGLDLAAGFLNLAEQAGKRYSTLSNLATLYQKATQDVKTATETLAATKDLDIAKMYINKAEESYDRRNRLQRLNSQYQEVTSQVNRYKAILENTKGLGEADKLLAMAEEKLKRVVRLKDLKARYDIKTQTKDQAETKVREAGRQMEEAERELAMAWDAAGGICPLCGNTVMKGDGCHV